MGQTLWRRFHGTVKCCEEDGCVCVCVCFRLGLGFDLQKVIQNPGQHHVMFGKPSLYLGAQEIRLGRMI